MGTISKIQTAKRELRAVASYLLHGDYAKKYLYVSHHKCATQYTRSILVDICHWKHIRHVKRDWRTPVSGWDIRANKFLLLTDYSSEIINLQEIHGRGFHVIRDPRDILVSMYFSHLYTHNINHQAKDIKRNRSVLSTVGKEEGLQFLMVHSDYYTRVMEEMSRWEYSDERFYETTFERLTSDPLREFEIILSFLGIQVATEALEQIMKRNTFASLKANWATRHPQNDHNHYRSGQAGDWINHFTAPAKEHFKERYGDLLIRLGYEQDHSW